jgi:replication-associated recombination protein RarA
MVTKRGYDFFAATSSMQKAIRRNDPAIAGYFALELYHSKYCFYVWKRLLTISAEDCAGIITKEIIALYESWKLINEGKPAEDEPKGRIFVSKAVLILCDCIKNRDSDHLQNLIYDAKKIDDNRVESFLKDQEKLPGKLDIPEYAFDVHTQKGRREGKTKTDFFVDELKGLRPRQIGLFDALIEQPG